MKKTTEMQEKKTKEKKQESSVLYTIVDRYQNFCSQGKINSGDIEVDEMYLNRWFTY